MITLSVVIPTRGRAAWARRAAESVFRQSATPLEILVVCNPAPDPDVERWATEFPASLRVLTSDRAGAASARNVGIEAARGEWVAFLDDDDEWRHDKWSRQLDLQRRFPNAVAVFSDAWIREADGSQSRTVWTRQPPAAGDVRASLAADNFIPTSSMAVRRDVLSKAGGFRPEFEPAEDYDLWLRIARLGPMAFDPEPTVVYHVHTGQTGARLGPMHAACASALEMWSRDESDAGAASIARRRVFELTRAAAQAFGRDGDFVHARQWSRRAVALRPWSASALWKWARFCRITRIYV